MALADFTDSEFDEVYAPPLRIRQDWVILTPPVSKDSKKRLFLERHGRRISTGQVKIFREKGCWMSGQDAWPHTPLNLRVFIGQTLDVTLLSKFTVALQCTASYDQPFLEDSTLARLSRDGTEMGLLGFHSSVHDIYGGVWGQEYK